MKIKLNIESVLIKTGLPQYNTHALIVCGPAQMSAFPNKKIESALVSEMITIILDQIEHLLDRNVDRS